MLLRKTKSAVLVLTSLSLFSAGCASKGSMDPASVRRLAVMPFEDATAQKDFGDVAEGVGRHLSTSLGTAQGIGVVAHHSSLQYEVRPRVLKEVQAALNVDAVLEGNVNIAGETMTVSAWLRDARSDQRVWETKAVGKRESAFVLAEDVAHGLAKWLNKPLRMKKSTAPPDWKHFLYLLEGTKLTDRLDANNLNLAIHDLETLRGDNPEFWPAHIPTAGLFGRLIAQEFLTKDRAREWVKGILYDIRQAEPDSAEAHYVQGALKYYVDWDFAAAEAALKKAIEARPNLAYSWHALAQLYITTNRLPLALETIQKASDLDPLGWETQREFATALAANGRFDEALEKLEFAGTLSKQERAIAADQGLFQFAKGNAEAARLILTSLAEPKDELAGIQALYGAAQAKLGKPEEAKRMLDLLLTRPKREVVPADPIHVALLRLSLGDTAKGFAELDNALAARRTLSLRIPGMAQFVAYREDPQWKALVAKLVASKPFQAPPASN